MVLPFHQIEGVQNGLVIDQSQENHFNCSSTTAAVRFESFFSLSSAVIRERDITFYFINTDIWSQ
jgi:hypothetical protein